MSSQGDINELVGKEAFKQVDQMNTKLDAMVDKCVKVTETATAMTAAFGKTGGGGLKQQVTDVEQLTKANEALANSNTDLAKQLAIVAEAKRQQNALNRLEAKEALAVKSSYDELNAKLELMKLAYKRLTEAQQENTAEGKRLAAQMDIASNKLKTMDAAMGVHTRHVGDYKNQLKDLGKTIQDNVAKYNSLSAAEQKAASGTQLKAHILDLGATYRNLATGTSTAATNMMTFESVIAKTPTAVDKVTKGVGSLWSVIRQAAYILPGLGIAGIIGMIGEGISMALPQIGEFFDKLVNGNKEAIEKAKALSEEIGKQTGKFETLTRRLNDHNLSKADHIRAAKELQELYPTALKNYSLEEIAAGKAAGAIEKIKDALIAVAMARAAQADIDKMAGEKWGNIAKMQELNAKLITEQENADKQRKIIQDRANSGMGNVGVNSLGIDLAQREKHINSLIDQVTTLAQRNTELDKSMNDVSESINRFDASAKAAGLKEDGSDASSKGGKKGTTKKASGNELFPFKGDSFEGPGKSGGLSKEDIKIVTDAWEQFYGKVAEYRGEFYDEGLSQAEAFSLNEQLINRKSLYQQRLDRKKAYEAMVESFKELQKVIQDFSEVANNVTEIINARELAAIEERSKAQDEFYKNQLRFIEQSGYSTSEKEKMRQRLEAETEAKRKANDRERISALRKQASIQKALDMLSIIGSTATAVMAALGAKPYTPANILLAAGAGAAGASQLAKVIATPLPQYAKGRKGGREEWAEVNEQGSELIVDHSSGKAYIANEGKRGATLLPQGADVIPADITKQIMNAAYVSLAGQGQVTTDKLQEVVADKFDELIYENKLLRKELKAKSMSATYNSLNGFYSYKENNRL